MAKTVYVVAYPSALSAPSAAQIASGKDVNGSSASYRNGGQTWTGSGQFGDATGLDLNTSYRFASTVYDSETETYSNVVVSDPWTTTAIGTDSILFVGGVSGSRAGSTSTTTQSLSGTLTEGIATSPAPGDLIIIAVGVGSQGRNPSCSISGWSMIGLQQNEASVTYDTSMQVSYMIAGSTPPTEITIPSTGNVDDGQAWRVLVFRGIDTTNPFDTSPTSTTATGTTTNRPNPPSISPTTKGAFVVTFGAGASTSTAAFTSSDLSAFASSSGSDTNDLVLGGGYIEWSGSGSVDPAQFGGGASGSTFSWVAKSIALRPRGNGLQQEFTTIGTHSFVVPDGVTQISAVTVGGGGGGIRSTSGGTGGGGGDLRYSANISVTPGEVLTITVGSGGNNGTSPTAGGESSIFRDSTRLLSAAGGGAGRAGNTTGTKNGTSSGTGGNGGTSAATNASTASGGGGAGGYSGNGGNAGVTAAGSAGSGGGGGGGGGGGSPSTGVYGGMGGGVGIYGAGSNGSGGTYNISAYGGPGGGGSGGESGDTLPVGTADGGRYGGGGGGLNHTSDYAGNGRQGAVRIIWGTGREYPSTNTADYFPPTATQIKYWNGSSWVEYSLKYWNGTAWTEAILQRWNGSAWVET